MAILCALVLSCTAAAASPTYTLVPEESVFAVITHKAGVAAALAHDHFIYPSSYDVQMAGSSDDPASCSFQLKFAVKDLVVDDPAADAKWYPAVSALGVEDRPFHELDTGTRDKIRGNMVSKGQLDEAHFPAITAELKGLKAAESTRGKTTFHYVADVALTLKGQSVTRPFAVNVRADDGTLHIEGIGEFAFSAFGIEPYSAYFGAVKNEDPFAIYVNFTAHMEDAAPAP